MGGCTKLGVRVVSFCSCLLLLRFQIRLQFLHGCLLCCQEMLQFCHALFQTIDLSLLCLQLVGVFGIRSVFFCLRCKHCFETLHFHFKLLVVFLELSDVLLFSFQFLEFLASNLDSRTTLESKNCRLDFEVILSSGLCSFEGLNFDGSQKTTGLIPSKRSLESNGTFLRTYVPASADLHSVVISDEQRSRRLSQFNPPRAALETTVASLYGIDCIKKNVILLSFLQTT
mmetsp:Transcript_91025/g.254295  ORF Transcript_91025/g.254295 Transcript_91025/m.254295 type:complete len:228 (-) Transcript_91025:2839-3522(-)